MTKPSLNTDIVKESLRWVSENKGLEVVTKGGYYCSPRVSSEITDCSMPMTFDQYQYCSLGCNYCFAYFFKMNNPSVKEVTLKAADVHGIIQAMQGKPKNKRDTRFYEYFYSRKFLFHWGGLADPFCNFEAKNGVGYTLMEALGSMNYPTLFSFKGDTIFKPKYVDLFQRYSKQKNFAFQISMVTSDDNLAKLVEIGVPAPSKRLEAIKMLSDLGYWTILRLRPFIIGVTDETLEDLLEKAYAAGIKAVSLEFYALDSRATPEAKRRYEWMGKLIGANKLEKYFADLSPSERGGYRRLNRLVKERFVKTIYKFCVQNDLIFGCSDPDFKELNMSGSCCGMPDSYKPNSLLENWTRNQLTYHLKEARKEYHNKGSIRLFKFNDIYKDEPYFYDRGTLANDHVCIIRYCEADRVALTYENIIKTYWNNLRSPANPANYLHGKVLPCGLDDDGNFVYKYNPSPYEQEWVNEGINLKV